LPSSLQEQLKTLMNKNRLDSGSFDIILTPESEYIFLEVNPIGQFQWLSRNCNYFLEKEIAELLIKL
jgi:D-alanine-D-alanine ligase-like ATP-grasp enzyme